jgi:Protein of unknown function (DUF4019)
MTDLMMICAPEFSSRLLLALTMGGLLMMQGPNIARGSEKSARFPEEINVTTDSEPGWYPVPELAARAETTANKYFAEFDEGKFPAAYAMLADIFRKHASQAQFIAYGEKSNQEYGSVISRRYLKVTWTKDPAVGPFNGIYAAIDVAAKYSAADRSCGYIVLYQPPGEDNFQVMRIEANTLSNATAAAIKKSQSQEAVDEAWAAMSANCPNYAMD